MNPHRLSITIGGVVLVVVLALGVILGCCLLGAATLLIIRQGNVPAINPVVTLVPRVIQPTPPPVPTPATEPVPGEAEETLLALESADVPEADLHELAIRFLGVPSDTPRVASVTNPDYPVGTVRTFNVSNLDAEQNYQIDADLVYKTPHVYMWVEQGLSVNMQDIQEAADLFESHTYPTDREFFGSEWTPGVDGDPHLSILHASDLGQTVAGYFSSADEYVKAVRTDTNEMEMFYIHIDKGTSVGDPFYNGVLAHEFQHMIHWNNDRNETTWMNEGCSELAMELNSRTYTQDPSAYDVGGSEYAYLDEPDTQLNTWPEVDLTGAAAPHYGASYLFLSYFLDRFGEDATKSLVAREENGLESVDLVLKDELGLSLTHKDLFADWVVANLVDDPSIAQGQYGYQAIDIYAPAIDQTYSPNTRYPQTRQTTVDQYGVDYIEINGNQPVTLNFVGSTQTRLMDTEAHSGKYLWWSNRGDESDPRLTQIVDLTGAQAASLAFWSWYYIEEDWDYAYVVVGTTADGTIPDDLSSPDISWHILDDPGLGCTTTNPNSGNLGCGLTGQSQGWEHLSADLSEFAGQQIALRFEYITDAAVNQSGFAVDDVQVTVDGQTLVDDDVEEGPGNWTAEGFVRHANVLPEEWMVQLVTYGPGSQIQVERLIDADATSGTWTIPLGSGVGKAVVAVSAMAPVTTEAAAYEYTLTTAP